MLDELNRRGVIRAAAAYVAIAWGGTEILSFLVDAFWLNQGFIALVILLIAIPVMLLRTLTIRDNPAMVRRRFAVMCIYAATAVLVLGSNYMNNRIARKRAELLIEACEDYKTKYGRWPKGLTELIPEFFKKIPKAKYTLAFNEFHYTSDRGKHTLMYNSIPPFGRKYYLFEKKKWIFLD